MLDKCSDKVFTGLHYCHSTPAQAQAVQAAVQAPAPQRAPSKPSSSELRPEKLTHDASTSTFRTWKKQFKVYFDATQMGALPCSQQQGYLCNCLDSILRARIDREATGTTPVYSPIVGLFTCIAILDNTFLESYPIHVRRKQFFDARQKEGQSAIEFRKELLSLLEEADGVNIACDDLLCMMLQIGLSDSSLQLELRSVCNPTLATICSFEQARHTLSSSAYGNAVSRTGNSLNKRNSGQSGRPVAKNLPASGKVERYQCLALRGKCFRCAKPDHMLTACSYTETVKCNLCGAAGHVTPACGRHQIAQMVQDHQIPPSSSPSSSQTSHQLAIAYKGGSHFSADGSASWPLPYSSSSTTSSSTSAGAFYTPSNLPTPEMPL